MVFNLNSSQVPNGSVILLGIRYDSRQDDPDAQRGRANPKVFTYAALKTGGLWYLTGSGKVPTAAGWQAVLRWLAKEGRTVVWARVATGFTEFYSPPIEGESYPLSIQGAPVDTSQSSR